MNAQSDSSSETNEPVVFDPFDPEFAATPFPLLRRLREQDPVHHSPQGFWVLTRYDDVAAVLRNTREFGGGNRRESVRARFGDGAAFAYASRRINLFDPPDHTRLRTLVTRAEAQIIFGTLCRRYPHLELVEEDIEWRVTFSFRGPVALYVITS